MLDRTVKLTLAIAGVLVLVSCTHEPFLRLVPAGESKKLTRHPLPVICAVDKMPALDRDYSVYNFPGGNEAILSSSRQGLINWLRGTDLFWEVAPTEDLKIEPDIIIRPTVVRFGWLQRAGQTYPVAFTAATLGIYPLVGGPFWWPRAYFRLAFDIQTRGGVHIGSFVSRKEVTETVSLYRASENQPETLLGRAFADVLKQLCAELREKRAHITRLVRKERPAQFGPPLVRFLTPEQKCVMPVGPVEIRGGVLAREGIGSVAFRMNARRLKKGEVQLDWHGRDMVHFIYKGEITPGRNVFECRVTDRAGQPNGTAYITIYTSPPEPETPPEPGNKASGLWRPKKTNKEP